MLSAVLFHNNMTNNIKVVRLIDLRLWANLTLDKTEHNPISVVRCHANRLDKPNYTLNHQQPRLAPKQMRLIILNNLYE